MSKTNKQDKIKIFISYARTETAIADRIVEKLESQNYEVKIDRRDLPYGEEWQKELEDFIQSADTVLILVSAKSISSQWCRWELAQVNSHNKRLIPVMIDAVSPQELPPEIGRVHLLPAQGVFDLDTHFDDLLNTIERDTSWLKTHTRLSDRAREWRAQNKTKALLLRGQPLKEAEQWVNKQPKSAPAPSEDAVELILASRQASTRRQRSAIFALMVIALTATGLAGLALYQRNIAIKQEQLALQAEKRATEQRLKAEQSLDTALNAQKNFIVNFAKSNKVVLYLGRESTLDLFTKFQEQLAELEQASPDSARIKKFRFETNVEIPHLFAGYSILMRKGSRLKLKKLLMAMAQDGYEIAKDLWRQKGENNDRATKLLIAKAYYSHMTYRFYDSGVRKIEDGTLPQQILHALDQAKPLKGSELDLFYQYTVSRAMALLSAKNTANALGLIETALNIAHRNAKGTLPGKHANNAAKYKGRVDDLIKYLSRENQGRSALKHYGKMQSGLTKSLNAELERTEGGTKIQSHVMLEKLVTLVAEAKTTHARLSHDYETYRGVANNSAITQYIEANEYWDKMKKIFTSDAFFIKADYGQTLNNCSIAEIYIKKLTPASTQYLKKCMSGLRSHIKYKNNHNDITRYLKLVDKIQTGQNAEAKKLIDFKFSCRLPNELLKSLNSTLKKMKHIRSSANFRKSWRDKLRYASANAYICGNLNSAESFVRLHNKLVKKPDHIKSYLLSLTLHMFTGKLDNMKPLLDVIRPSERHRVVTTLKDNVLNFQGGRTKPPANKEKIILWFDNYLATLEVNTNTSSSQ